MIAQFLDAWFNGNKLEPSNIWQIFVQLLTEFDLPIWTIALICSWDLGGGRIRGELGVERHEFTTAEADRFITCLFYGIINKWLFYCIIP